MKKYIVLLLLFLSAFTLYSQQSIPSRVWQAKVQVIGVETLTGDNFLCDFSYFQNPVFKSYKGETTIQKVSFDGTLIRLSLYHIKDKSRSRIDYLFKYSPKSNMVEFLGTEDYAEDCKTVKPYSKEEDKVMSLMIYLFQLENYRR